MDKELGHVAVICPLWFSVSLFVNQDADLNDPNSPFRGDVLFLNQHVGLEEGLRGSEWHCLESGLNWAWPKRMDLQDERGQVSLDFLSFSHPQFCSQTQFP